MADTELSLGFNLDQARKDAQEIPAILEDALKKIEGKGLTSLENSLKEAAKSAKGLDKPLDDAASALKSISSATNELKALSELKIPLAEEIKAEEQGVARLQNEWFRTWQVQPDAKGAKENRSQYEQLSAILANNKTLLAELDAEEARYNTVISQNEAIIRNTTSQIDAQKQSATQLTQQAETQVAAIEQKKLAEQGLVSDTKEEATNVANVTNSLNGATSAAGELSSTIKSMGTAASTPLNNVAQSATDVASAVSQLDDMRATVQNVLNFDSANAGIADLVTHLQELVTLENAMKKSNSVKEMADEYAKVREGIIVTKAAIKAWDNEVKQANASAQQGTGETTSAFERMKATFSTVGSSIKQGFSTVSGVVSKVRTSFQTVQRVVVKVTSVMKSAVNGFVKMAKSGFNALVKTIGKIKSAFSSMARDNQRSFKHLLTSITKYVFGFRSLFFLIRRIRKYIGEGIQSMAKFNGGNNSVNKNISQLITSLEYLKNAWSTAFSPILDFVTSWLTALIDKLASVGNAFSRFLGNLLGISKVFQAVKGPTKNYAKSLDKAGKSAGGAAKKQKKLNDRLADFDDLHVLGKDNDNKGAGGGGGSGGNDDDEKRNNKLWDFAKVGKNLQKALKEMWASADFTILGKKISDGLSKALDNINWAKIKLKAYKIGKSIATFLNGALADKRLWESAGKALGEGVNTLMELISGFLENNKVDWGGNFAKFINKLFETIDWNAVKKNIKLFVDKLVANINSFLATLDKSKIGEGVSTLSEGITYFISSAISKINWGELLELLKSVGGSIIDGITAGFNQSENPFVQAVSGLIGSIKQAFEEGDVTTAASGLTTFIKKIFANIKLDDVVTGLKNFFGQLFSDIFEGINADPNSALGGLIQSFQMVASVIGNIFSAVMQLLPQLLPGILMVTEASMNFFNALIPIVQEILPIISTSMGYITQIISSVLTPVLQILTPIISFICSILKLIMPIFDEIVSLINEAFGGITDLIEPLTSLLSSIIEPLAAFLSPIMSITKIIFGLIKSILSPIMDLISPLTELLGDILAPLFNILGLIGDIIESGIVPIFGAFSGIIQAVVVPILKVLVTGIKAIISVFGMFSDAINFVISLFRLGFQELGKWFKGWVNGFLDVVCGVVNGVIEALNTGIRGINKLAIDIPDWVPIVGGKKFGFNIKELRTIKIPHLAQGAVIPPNNEFMAVLGDQSHGTNIEAPLDTIKQAVAEVLANNGNQEVIQLLQQLIAVVESKNLVIGDKAIGQANARYTNQQRIIRGTSF